MFDKTRDSIHGEMLKSISDDYDKTVGSFIYDATRPPADQLGLAYTDLNAVADKLNIENLSGAELEQRVYERTGIMRKRATYASTLVTITGKSGALINKGDKVSSDTVNYTFQESISIPEAGSATVLVQCDEPGAIGNVPASHIKFFPITLQGLTGVTNLFPVTNGYEAESDLELLTRYYERIQTPPTSGNKAHYKNWAKEVVGVGDAKIFPLWAGDNTVKVVIINSNKAPADEALMAAVQSHIDPDITGIGEGAAPIGAFCTVASAEGVTINISFYAVKDSAFTDQQRESLISNAITGYLKELAFKDSQVSYARIGAIILAAGGILDYSDLLLNGDTKNIHIGETEVPVLGAITFD